VRRAVQVLKVLQVLKAQPVHKVLQDHRDQLVSLVPPAQQVLLVQLDQLVLKVHKVVLVQPVHKVLRVLLDQLVLKVHRVHKALLVQPGRLVLQVQHLAISRLFTASLVTGIQISKLRLPVKSV
jgi:hypothetical protein